jgi:hypothetical protein
MSLNALRKASSASRISLKPEEASPSREYFVPIFTQDEIEEINTLKGEAQKYSKYAEEGWFDKMVAREAELASDSLEGCIDSLEVLTDHWNNAIEIGKLMFERQIYYNKAIGLAQTLVSYGLVEMASVHHYLRFATAPTLSIGISHSRVKEILLELQHALNGMRRVCMCNMAECCCGTVTP